MVGRVRRVIVCPDGSSRAFGKLIGGFFRSRVDGFERERRVCLDSGKMRCIEDDPSVSAITMLRGNGHRPRRAKIPAPMMAIPIDILLQ